jgi:hypothetical protein
METFDTNLQSDHERNECRHLEMRLKKKDEEIFNLKTVMIAAAEEIQEHWQAHCDSEGYGPANLMHRLEKGIPAQYGYTAGEFAKQDSRIKELEERVKELQEIIVNFIIIDLNIRH